VIGCHPPNRTWQKHTGAQLKFCQKSGQNYAFRPTSGYSRFAPYEKEIWADQPQE